MIKKVSGNFEKYLNSRIEAIKQAAIRELCIIGEKCVNTARSLPSPNPAFFEGRIPPHQPNYIDWSGNLRSSIGYVVVADGEIVSESSFESNGNGTDGSREGREFAHRLATEFPQGIVLILVAGMNYSKYVASRGYDVLDSAELIAHKLLKEVKIL